MERQATLDRIEQIFFNFAEQLGFMQQITESDTMYAVLYSIGNQALKLVIDWRDYYLNVFVVRMLNGELPLNDYDSKSKRTFSVSVCDVYNIEYPICVDKDKRTGESLLCTLNTIISIVLKDPDVLLRFVDNIEENTSPEKTREYHRRNVLRRIGMLEMRHVSGELNERAYKILYDDLTKVLNSI